jgi:hypothetical protein
LVFICDEDKVIESYRQRLASPVSPESEFLDWGQVARMQELTRNHQRKDIKLSIYTTFTVRPGGTEGGDVTQQLITRRSINAEASASRKTIDVGAQINTERSVDAQKQLYTGDVPENVAVIILVYRNSPSEIDDACRLISGYINQPAELIREMQYTWSIWLDTLLLRQRPQLTFPFKQTRHFLCQ